MIDTITKDSAYLKMVDERLRERNAKAQLKLERIIYLGMTRDEMISFVEGAEHRRKQWLYEWCSRPSYRELLRKYNHE